MHKARTEDRTKDGEEEKWSSGSSDNRDQVDQLHIAEQQKSWTRDNVEQDDQADQVKNNQTDNCKVGSQFWFHYLTNPSSCSTDSTNVKFFWMLLFSSKSWGCPLQNWI